jgi:hypothetical protein
MLAFVGVGDTAIVECDRLVLRVLLAGLDQCRAGGDAEIRVRAFAPTPRLRCILGSIRILSSGYART